MKTYKGWEKANVDLDEYLTEPCQINEELFMYLLEVTSCKYGFRSDDNTFLMQTGGANHEIAGRNYYMSCLETNGKYFYLGILPEVKQPKISKWNTFI